MRNTLFANILKVTAIGFFIIVVLGFAYLKTRDLFLGVRTEIIGIKDGANYTDPFLTITGQAKGARGLTINGDLIFIDPAGYFRDERILFPGYNELTIATTDRFKKTRSRTYRVTYSP